MAGDAENRYDRQELINGWNQEKLNNSKIAIAGTGHCANFLAASLGALGIGDVRIYGDERADYEIFGREYSDREFLLSRTRENASKAETLEGVIRKINPLIDVFGVHMGLDIVSESLIEPPDILVIANNDKNVISGYQKYASRRGINFYVFLGGREGAMFLKRPEIKDIPDFSHDVPEGITSEVVSGFLAGEIVKDLMGGKGIDKIEYSARGDNRFSLNGEVNKGFKKARGIDKTALVIGAGALGNFFGIGMFYAGLKNMYLVDDDVIETTNLNRQIMFYDAVGKFKNEILAERLMYLNPDMNIEPIKQRIDENFEDNLKKLNPDIIVDCVDNLATRAILNYFAIKYQIPFISGGTDYKAGQVIVYEPEKSSCLECKLKVNKALAKERASHSCIHATNPSVVVSNQIIGGLMANEARCVLDSENYGQAVRKTIKYDSEKSIRVGLIGSDEKCDCRPRKTAKKWVEDLVKEVESEEIKQ